MKSWPNLEISHAPQVSISPAIDKQLLIQKCFEQLFSTYSWFSFEFFWQNNVGAKTAHKMWVKSTTGVDFTNILQAAFVSTDFKAQRPYFCAFGICTRKSCA